MIRSLRDKLQQGSASAKQMQRFQIIDGIVYTSADPPAPFIPPSVRPLLLSEAHDSLVGGHWGVTKTTARLADFYWPSLHADVATYCRTCEVCQRTKYKTRAEGRFTGIVARHPQDLVVVDFKFMPRSRSGFKYLCIICDNYSHFASGYAMKTLVSAEVIECFKRYLFTFGCFRTVLCDFGSNLTSREFRDFTINLGANIEYAPIYHHSTSGLAEALIKTIADRITMYCQESLDHWEDVVAPSLFAVNASKRLSLNTSPFELMFGYQPLLPSTIALCLPRCLPPAAKLTQHFELRARAQEYLLKAHEAQKKYFESRRRHVEYKKKQQVLVFRRCTKRAAKFYYKFHGPYRIKRRTGLSSYVVRIKVRNRYKLRKFHCTQLKPYYKRNPCPLPPPDLHVPPAVLE